MLLNRCGSDSTLLELGDGCLWDELDVVFGKLSFLQQVTQKGLDIKHILNATEQTREENKSTRDDFLRWRRKVKELVAT